MENHYPFDLDGATFADPAISACPFAFYRQLREQAPVHRDPAIGYYWITPRKKVLEAVQDTDHFSSNTDLQFRGTYRPRAQKVWDDAGIELTYTLLTSDPPEHQEYRRFAMSMFTPKLVKDIALRVEVIVQELLSGFVDDGEVEFASRFASLLPATVVCDEYGFAREDRSKFKAWADSVLLLQTPGISEDEEVALVTKVAELFQFLVGHLSRPRTRDEGRIMYDLATLNRSDGTPFTLIERAWMAITIFIGGVDTTANTLVSMINYLCEHPELQDELRGDEAKISAFVEEILRLHGPVQAIARRAKTKFSFGGEQIGAGADIMLCLGAANRDETYWSEPDAVKLDRPNGRQHLSFGSGRHVCVGMHLARQELQIALRLILDRVENIRLSDPENPPQYLPLPIFRGIATLPIRFDKRG